SVIRIASRSGTWVLCVRSNASRICWGDKSSATLAMARARLSLLRVARAFCNRVLNSFRSSDDDLGCGISVWASGFGDSNRGPFSGDEAAAQNHPIIAPATKAPATNPLIGTLLGVMTVVGTFGPRHRSLQFQSPAALLRSIEPSEFQHKPRTLQVQP